MPRQLVCDALPENKTLLDLDMLVKHCKIICI